MTRKSTPTAKFLTGDAVFAGWRDNVLTGTGPVMFPHTLPVPEISPGHVTLLGGAPGAGKTALVMSCIVEALRHTPTLRALVANVEMSPAALLDRQLARRLDRRRTEPVRAGGCRAHSLHSTPWVRRVEKSFFAPHPSR